MSRHCPLSHWLQGSGRQGRGLANSLLACSPGLWPGPDVRILLSACGWWGWAVSKGGSSSRSDLWTPRELPLAPRISPCPETVVAIESTAPEASGVKDPATRSQTNCNSNSGPASGSLHDLGQVSCLLSDSVSSSTNGPVADPLWGSVYVYIFM